MAKEKEEIEKPVFPIEAEETDQKVKVEEGYRYTVQNDGTVTRLPTYKIWDEKQKAAVKLYTKAYNEWKQKKLQKTRDYNFRRGAAKAKKEDKAIFKQAREEKRKAQNAVKDAEAKKRIEDRIAKDTARLAKLKE